MTQNDNNKKKENEDIHYKSMSEYTYEECGFSILEYEKKWSWIVIPFDIIKTKKYVYQNLNKSIIEVLPHNIYNYSDGHESEPDKIVEVLLKKKLTFSEELTSFLYDTGFKVYWFH